VYFPHFTLYICYTVYGVVQSLYNQNDGIRVKSLLWFKQCTVFFRRMVNHCFTLNWFHQ